MQLSEKQISEIAELLDCGQICYFHKLTGKIEHHPDPDSLYFEVDQWEEDISNINANSEDYLRFEPMQSHDSYKVMQSFTDTITDNQTAEKLVTALSKPNPFRNFKYQVERLRLLDRWYNFKQQTLEEWVKQKIFTL